MFVSNLQLMSRFGGLEVSVLASGARVRGFEPGGFFGRK